MPRIRGELHREEHGLETSPNFTTTRDTRTSSGATVQTKKGQSWEVHEVNILVIKNLSYTFTVVELLRLGARDDEREFLFQRMAFARGNRSAVFMPV